MYSSSPPSTCSRLLVFLFFFLCSPLSFPFLRLPVIPCWGLAPVCLLAPVYAILIATGGHIRAPRSPHFSLYKEQQYNVFYTPSWVFCSLLSTVRGISKPPTLVTSVVCLVAGVKGHPQRGGRRSGVPFCGVLSPSKQCLFGRQAHSVLLNFKCPTTNPPEARKSGEREVELRLPHRCSVLSPPSWGGSFVCAMQKDTQMVFLSLCLSLSVAFSVFSRVLLRQSPQQQH